MEAGHADDKLIADNAKKLKQQISESVVSVTPFVLRLKFVFTADVFDFSLMVLCFFNLYLIDPLSGDIKPEFVNISIHQPPSLPVF